MSDTVRILHLISAEGNWEPFTGMAALCAALREYGMTSVIATPDHSRLWELAQASGVETADYALELSINPFRWKELGELVRKTGASIVHAHDIDSTTLLARSRMLFGRGAAVAVSRYDLRSQLSGAEYGGGVDALVCPSKCLAGMYRERGVEEDKIHVVRNGINMAATDRAVEDRENVRAYYRETYCKGKEKPRFLVNISPFDEFGGQPDIIEAMPDILAALPQAHLFLMGEGPAREDMEKLAKLRAVEKEVSFLEPDKAFHRLLAAADLYVASGKNDISGFMIETAMMAGCGILARDSGCYREILQNGECGVLADENGLKEPIIEILKDRQRREKLGRAARTRAAKEYTAAIQAGKLAEVYRKIAPHD